MPNDLAAAAEFRRVVEISSLCAVDKRLRFTADVDERKALAARFGLLALGRLEAAADVRRLQGGGARARVEFEADVVQSCVVTLDPVESRIAEAFELDFLPPGESTGDMEAAETAGGGEPPGAVAGGAFDLGAIIAEYVALAIEPYPRRPDAEPGTWREPPEKSGEGPLGALKEWRGKA